MKEKIAIEYIRQAMKEKGIINYSIEPVSLVVDNNTNRTISDDGCYYYPCWWGMNVFPTGGSIIISQLEARIEGNYEFWEEVGAVEFYGQFIISVSGFVGVRVKYPVQFLKVVIGENE